MGRLVTTGFSNDLGQPEAQGVCLSLDQPAGKSVAKKACSVVLSLLTG